MRKTTPWLALTCLAMGAHAQGTEQIRRATLSGSRGDSGKCTIEVRVDMAAEVDIYGDSARLRTLGGQPSQWMRMDCTDAMPADLADFRFRGIDGRGTQRLLQDPRNNRGMAVVRIEDSKSGSEGYTFDIEWSGGRGGAPTGGFTNGGGFNGGLNRGGNGQGRGNRFSPEEAIDACRNEVRTRGERDYSLRNLQLTSVASDRGQGRRDWVTGSFTARSGVMQRGGEFRFNCLVDFNSGQVRTLEIVRPDGTVMTPGGGPGNAARYDQNAVLRSCQDAVIARTNRDGYQDANFIATSIDTRRNDTVMGAVTARRGPVSDTFDFSCTMDFNNASVRNVDVRRR
ncbi:MAG: hypothetical protein ABI759_02240 [Candidatus Solibacter sp.]